MCTLARCSSVYLIPVCVSNEDTRHKKMDERYQSNFTQHFNVIIIFKINGTIALKFFLG